MELQAEKDGAELSLQIIHQVQGELEHYSLAYREQQMQLEARDRAFQELRLSKATQASSHELEIDALRLQFDRQLAGLEERLASCHAELRDVSETAELTVLQLNQVQEELERFFLKARASDRLAQAQFEQMQRAQRLMLRLHPDVLPTPPNPLAIAVEVLPEAAAVMPKYTLETEALLSTYAESLQRASALLERARRI
jgi:hypothetical protein